MNDMTKTERQPLDQQAVLRTINLKELHNLVAFDLDNITKDFAGTTGLVDQAMRVPMDITTWTGDIFAATGDLRRMIKGRLGLAEDLRLLCTKPINDGIKDINRLFRERVEPAKKADDHVARLRVRWEKAEERRVKAEQERLRKEAEEVALAEAERLQEAAEQARLAEAQAVEAGDQDTAEMAAEVAEQAEQARDEVLVQPSLEPIADPSVRDVRGLYGSVGGARKTWKAKVVDLRALSDVCVKAIMANDKAVDAIRIALREFTEPRLEVLRKGGQAEPLLGIEFEQETSDSVR